MSNWFGHFCPNQFVLSCWLSSDFLLLDCNSGGKVWKEEWKNQDKNQISQMGHTLCILWIGSMVVLVNKMPAITNLWFFLAALMKVIHAALQLINFVRRKGQVCIFGSHTYCFISNCSAGESLLLWIKLLESAAPPDDWRDWTEQLCLIVWQHCQYKVDYSSKWQSDLYNVIV